jgi:hypothetical protein
MTEEKAMIETTAQTLKSDGDGPFDLQSIGVFWSVLSFLMISFWAPNMIALSQENMFTCRPMRCQIKISVLRAPLTVTSSKPALLAHPQMSDFILSRPGSAGAPFGL